ncbi:alpha/beta hydrolase family protein [Zhongshania sp.]|uniref:alpha/beta hydrolase family protein n=1 Tax=Zhongshania sp. TaxID=1971902 RepID=UPI003568ADBC
MPPSVLPPVKKSPPWWRSLPEDFYCQSDGTELDSEYPIQVYGTAIMDRMMRTGLGLMISSTLVPQLFKGDGMARERSQMDFYAGLAASQDVDTVFIPPPKVEVETHKIGRFNYKPKGIPAVELRFTSPFTPLNPELTDSYLSYERNRTANAQYWTHPDGPRPTLIFVHGVVESWYGFNSLFFSLRWFYDNGYDILLMTQPFHGARAEPCHPFSGYGLFAGGFSQLNEGMLQAVCDTRVIIDYLFERGAPHVGISGLSLGGYLSSIMAVVEPRLAFCIPNSPLVAPVDTLRSWQPTGRLMDLIGQRTGLTPMDLRRGLAIHSPLSYQPKLDPERVMIIGGAGDRFTPPRFVRLLHAHWPESHLHWFPGNHVVHLGQREYLKLMRRFMDRHCQGVPSEV